MSFLLEKIRSLFLSPQSPLELKLRTFYHRLSATRFFFQLQAWRAIRSYKRYRSHLKSQSLPDPSIFDKQPLVSFVLNYDADKQDPLFTTIKSIQRLHSPNWEIVLITPPGKEKDAFLSALTQDKQIGFTDNPQKDLPGELTGDYVIFCAAGDVFFEGLLTTFFECFNHNPPGDVYYFDSEVAAEGAAQPEPFFKPPAHSPELLLSVNPYSRGLIRKDILQKFRLAINTREDAILTEYDIILQLSENDANFEHIPHLLLTQTERVTSSLHNNHKIVSAHLSRLGLEQISSTKIGGALRFSWKTNEPSIAILIPSKNNERLLKNLIESILSRTDYAKYTIYIVDNHSDNQDTLAYYKSLKNDGRFSIIPYDDPFNYSQAVNLGVEESHSDLVLLLNDDMEVIDPFWLSELAQWALRPDIGVVGAQLIRENHMIQHAGIIIGLNGFAGHIYLNAPENHHGLFGSVNWYRDYLAVTGACQMMRRELFTQIGGYDEKFRLAFGDIDFCLRVHEHGFRNIYTPFAKLFHYEGKSRGYQTPVQDILYGYEKLQGYLINDDPYYSPNLTYTRIPRCSITEKSKSQKKEQIQTRIRFYQQK